MKSPFSDSVLVLVAHGSRRNADSSAPTYQHAAALRERGLFAGVREAFWQQAPHLQEVLRDITAPRVFVVPLFLGEGYFTGEVLPRELGFPPVRPAAFPRIRQDHGRQICYAGPVGTHPSLTDVILARAQDIVARHPGPGPLRPSDLTLFLAGHGTGQNDNSRKAIERQVDLISARRAYAGVHPLFLEEDPRIGDCYRLAATRHLVVVPCFISDGLHAACDIPVLLGESEHKVATRRQRGEWGWVNPTERQGFLVWYTRSLGSEPHLADVILQRVRETAAAAGT